MARRPLRRPPLPTPAERVPPQITPQVSMLSSLEDINSGKILRRAIKIFSLFLPDVDLDPFYSHLALQSRSAFAGVSPPSSGIAVAVPSTASVPLAAPSASAAGAPCSDVVCRSDVPSTLANHKPSREAMFLISSKQTMKFQSCQAIFPSQAPLGVPSSNFGKDFRKASVPFLSSPSFHLNDFSSRGTREACVQMTYSISNTVVGEFIKRRRCIISSDQFKADYEVSKLSGYFPFSSTFGGPK